MELMSLLRELEEEEEEEEEQAWPGKVFGW